MNNQVFILYDLSSTMVIGVYTDMNLLKEQAEEYAQKNEIELNIDLVCYNVTLNTIQQIGIDDKNLIPI